MSGAAVSSSAAQAKSSPHGGFLSLADHSVDVAAVAKALLTLPIIRGRLAALAEQPLDRVTLARLGFFVGLHDAGKVVHGFQARLRGEKPDCGHIGPICAVLFVAFPDNDLCKAINTSLRRRYWKSWFACYDPGGADDIVQPRDVERRYWQAVFAHHGSLPPDPQPADAKQWSERGGYAPLKELSIVVDRLRIMFSDAFTADEEAEALPGPPRFLHALAGLTTLADWLGSDASVFLFPSQGGPTGEVRIPWARDKARELVARRGLDPSAARTRCQETPSTFDSLFPGHRTPRPAQAALLREPLPKPGQIVTLEAETGSGKTEAALAHFFRLFQAGEVDGMYFALPTRAAAVQIHGRVTAAMRRWFGDASLSVGLAVPGYLRVGDAQGRRLPDQRDVLWPDDVDRDHSWAVERPKSYLCGWVMVGTVDQLLLGGLQVRHAQFRSGPMLRLLLVVDEVHASDAYMGVILKNVLDQHSVAGGHALLMSATLGAAARQELLAAGRRAKQNDLLSPDAAVACPYPAIQRSGEPPKALAHEGRAKRVAAELVDSDDVDALLGRIKAAADAGAAVLFIRNTVDDVRAAFRALEQRGAPLLRCAGKAAPHHSRYAPEDRRLLDAALEAAFRGEHRRGVVAVTSQTAEQSLDICADWLVTDLCPGDVLLQRIGRLHRHERRRPAGFEEARVSLIAPTAAQLERMFSAEGDVRGRSPLGIGRVYRDAVGVLATRDWLATHGVLRVPDDNRALVEVTTHPEALDDFADVLGERWAEHRRFVTGVNLGEGMTARSVMLKWQEPILENQIRDDRRVMTRLGMGQRRVELPEAQPGPFGAPVTSFILPDWWVAEDLPANAMAKDAAAEDDAISFRLSDNAYRYDRLGLARIDD